jgi:hypothetical protein
MSFVATIRAGDRVTIRDRFGKERTGRAVMRSSHGGWVLNMGGAHGTPGLADDSNIVSVKTPKPKAAHSHTGLRPRKKITRRRRRRGHAEGPVGTRAELDAEFNAALGRYIEGRCALATAPLEPFEEPVYEGPELEPTFEAAIDEEHPIERLTSVSEEDVVEPFERPEKF